MTPDRMNGPDVTPEAIRLLARAAGLDLAPERAAPLVPAVAALLAGDRGLAGLDLYVTPAAGPVWEEAARD